MGNELIIILVCGLTTVASRALPFILFPENKKTPAVIEYLGEYLPVAIMGMLIVYCLKDVDFTSGNYGILELIGILVVALLHLYKRNMILSIAGGTIFYCMMLQIF